MPSYIIEIYESSQSDSFVFADGREARSIAITPSDREAHSDMLSEAVLLISPVFVAILGREYLDFEVFDREIVWEEWDEL